MLADLEQAHHGCETAVERTSAGPYVRPFADFHGVSPRASRAVVGPTSPDVTTRRETDPRSRGRWVRFFVLLATTSIVLAPLVVVFAVAITRPADGPFRYPLGSFVYVLLKTKAAYWLENSLLASLSATVLAAAVAVPGGYVLSRARTRLARGWAIVLFVVQSIPVVALVIPLFFLFAKAELVDTIGTLIVLYVGTTAAVATWMFTGYVDTIPVSLEEAAWVDGASRVSALLRIVLPNALPGLLSVGVFSFLLAWNDYLVALVLLRTVENFTAPVGLSDVFDPGAKMALATLMMVPPVLVFAVFHRYFSVGGLSGSFAGR